MVTVNPGSRHGHQRAVRGSEIAASRRGVAGRVPTRPMIAVPTVLLWLGSAVIWVSATAVVLSDLSRWWLAVTIPVQGIVTFLIFTVLHESVHSAVGRLRWVNQLFGRLSMPFVSLLTTFPMFKYMHMSHHRNTNECIDADPDAWAQTGPRWQLPVRWFTIDAWYASFYFARLRSRPRKEAAGFLINLAVVIVLLLAAVVVWDWGLPILLIYVIPQRIGIGLLGWLFDWLPHHDLTGTAKVDRFRASRVRVGWERLMSPLLLFQNYHAVHHINPGVPFYLLGRTWERFESHYLDRKVPISTAWGREMTPTEYRAWRGRCHDVKR
jgi:beta-carotene hydroxylase